VFRTVLIANRGEIAYRVARTARELGMRVVAVYSTEDANSAVVRYADDAVRIGPGPARKSYLNMAAIIEAARRTGAEAIHPGYGFLSENADFAEVCGANGITFVGPPPKVIGLLGDKTSARALMSDAGLPMLPGSIDPLDNVAQAQKVADEVGYPVIVKAAAGGGGRGMQVATERGEFAHKYHEARSAAQLLFGDGRVYVERYLAPSATPYTWGSGTARSSAGTRSWSRRPPRRVCRTGSSSGWARPRSTARWPPGTWAPVPSSSSSTPTATSPSWRSTAASRWSTR